MLSLNFLTVNLSATSEPPVSVDGMEHEAAVSILQDDGALRKEAGDERTVFTRMHTHRMHEDARACAVTSPNENKKYKCVMSTFPNYNKSKKYKCVMSTFPNYNKS